MSLLDKFNNLEKLLKNENFKLTDLVTSISDLAGCNTYLLNANGNILASALPNGADCTKTAPGESLSLIPEFKQRIGFIFQTAANLPLESCIFKGENCCQPETVMTIVPVRNVRTTAGYLLLTKTKKHFSDDEILLAQTASLIACIYFYENQQMDGDMGDRDRVNAQMVLDSLSFSELKAISNVFKDLNGMEGFLVASKIADRIGISRSVIVNAMRKLESAGIVDSWSLGINGTYIKIKSQSFLDALKAQVK